MFMNEFPPALQHSELPQYCCNANLKSSLKHFAPARSEQVMKTLSRGSTMLRFAAYCVLLVLGFAVLRARVEIACSDASL